MKWTRWLLVPVAAAIPLTQAQIDTRLGGFRAQEEILYLWSGEHVKRLSAGFEGVAADLYWLRTVQYFGGKSVYSNDRRFGLLYPLIEITTTLDKRLEVAYRYGAIFLAEQPPVGAGRPRDGIAILERGVAAMPENWRLRKELGYFHFLFLHDSKRAAEILVEASELPGAAYWLKTLAAEILKQGGQRAMSRAIWQQMYEQSEEGAIKANALTHLRVLDALEARDQVRRSVEAFARRTGRLPASLTEVRFAGLLGGYAVDPSGVPLEYDAQSGEVSISKQSTLWRPEQ